MSNNTRIIEGSAETIHAEGTMVVVGSDQYFVTSKNQVQARDYVIKKLGLDVNQSINTYPSRITSSNIGEFLPTGHEHIYKLHSGSHYQAE